MAAPTTLGPIAGLILALIAAPAWVYYKLRGKK
jgi:hypothetical protein